MNNSSKIDHASMPLGIFASKNLAAWLPSRLAAKKSAFTLAEVLITLGIIGVVAALTIPSLISNYQDKQFKTAYKKAYSDISQVVQEGIIENKFTRTTKWNAEALSQEMNLFREKFKITVDCPVENHNISPCWKKGDTLCGGACSSGNTADGIDYENGAPYNNRSNCFLDASGRSWCSIDNSENLFLVDTNGFTPPNQFGKDRFIFTFGNSKGERTYQSSDYAKIIPYAKDTSSATYYCKHPPCYYYSWLYN